MKESPIQAQQSSKSGCWRLQQQGRGRTNQTTFALLEEKNVELRGSRDRGGRVRRGAKPDRATGSRDEGRRAVRLNDV